MTTACIRWWFAQTLMMQSRCSDDVFRCFYVHEAMHWKSNKSGSTRANCGNVSVFLLLLVIVGDPRAGFCLVIPHFAFSALTLLFVDFYMGWILLCGSAF